MPTERQRKAVAERQQRATAKSRDIEKVTQRVRGQIHKASELPQNQNFLIYGRPGSWKTRTCATAPNVLILDIQEEGTDSIRRDLDCDVLRVYYWSVIADDIYWYLQEGDHGYESVAIDGVTGLQEICMAFVLGDMVARDASKDPDLPSKQAWGKVNKLMRTLITNYRNLPMNVIFTATERARESGESSEDEEVVLVYGPNCSPGISSHLEQAVGTVGRMVKREVIVKNKKTKATRREVRRRMVVGDSERYISKDRNGVFGEYIDAPNISEMLAQIYSSDGKEA